MNSKALLLMAWLRHSRRRAQARWVSAPLGRRSCVFVKTRRARLVARRPADGGRPISGRVTQQRHGVCPVAWTHVHCEHQQIGVNIIVRQKVPSWFACLYTTLPSWVRQRSSPNNPRLSSRRWSSVSDNPRFTLLFPRARPPSFPRSRPIYAAAEKDLAVRAGAVSSVAARSSARNGVHAASRGDLRGHAVPTIAGILADPAGPIGRVAHRPSAGVSGRRSGLGPPPPFSIS